MERKKQKFNGKNLGVWFNRDQETMLREIEAVAARKKWSLAQTMIELAEAGLAVTKRGTIL